VEVFGGTVNLKHIVLTLNDDDALDWDQGWTGKAQFIAMHQNRLAGNHGIEADNSSSAPNATPRSAPEIWNATFLGSNRTAGQAAQTQGGANMRVGTAGKIMNAVFAYFNDFALDVGGADSAALAQAGTLDVTNSIFFNGKAALATGNFAESGSTNDGSFDEYAHFIGTLARNNQVIDPQLSAGLYVAPAAGAPANVPSFVPPALSPPLTGAATPPDDGFFDTTATFIGGVGTTDWLAGWTAYPES
jgi:hypothetical protein